MARQYQMSMRVQEYETDAALEELYMWFSMERPDAFFGCVASASRIEKNPTRVVIEFPAAEDEMAEFMASLAVQESGFQGHEYELKGL